MAVEHNMVFCATDWWGLAEQDTAYDITALQDLNNFPNVVDRLQQGVLNTLFLGRLMLNPKGFAANPAFRTRPLPGPVNIVPGQISSPLIDTSHLYYDGNSQGGIMGGMTTAVAPDFRRAVLGVSGMNYGNLLVQRSTDFAPFGQLLFGSYTGQVDGSRGPRPDAAALGPRRPGRIRAADDDAPAARHAVAHGADADRLRRPPGQHVLGCDGGAHDRRLGARARA